MNRSKEKAQGVADKVTPIFDLVGELTSEDIDYLEETSNLIQKDIVNLEAVAGVLVSLDKAEAKIIAGKAGIDRIEGIKLIWEALKKREEALKDFVTKKDMQKDIEKLFNL